MTRLFEDFEVPLGEGVAMLRGFALAEEDAVLAALESVTGAAPFRHMVTPGGFRMSVGMTNCGALGWVSDRSGYRYAPCDPETGKPWPAMPHAFAALSGRAAAAAGFSGFESDACLINRYAPGAKLTLHQDRNERDFSQPIVSVSLGIPAVFLFGGEHRSSPIRRVRLEHGDIVVWGGPARLFYHGIAPLKEAAHPRLGGCRVNLTFRRAG
ncbi:MAG: DNA oxidative demethylase AlkB [Acidobacteria bacterium]|nr:DNA oxidative demethylase AlkB [Acidobacteriota bacterium]